MAQSYIPSEIEQLSSSLRHLSRISRILDAIGLTVAAGILIDITFVLLLFYNFVLHLPSKGTYPKPEDTYAALGIIIFLTNMSAIVLFEFYKRNGTALFTILNDQMQELYGSSQPSDNVNYRSARLPLKLFINSSELPFFPGKLGIMVAILLNVCFIILVMYVLARQSGVA